MRGIFCLGSFLACTGASRDGEDVRGSEGATRATACPEPCTSKEHVNTIACLAQAFTARRASGSVTQKTLCMPRGAESSTPRGERSPEALQERFLKHLRLSVEFLVRQSLGLPSLVGPLWLIPVRPTAVIRCLRAVADLDTPYEEITSDSDWDEEDLAIEGPTTPETWSPLEEEECQ